MSLALLAAPVVGVLALLYAFMQAGWIRRQDEGTPRMAEIAGYIAAGARAFLAREYKVLAVFGVAVAALLALVNFLNPDAGSHWLVAVAFIIGAVASALAGNLGMRVATAANVRTTQAARTSLAQALKVSFTGGSVMGLGVAGLAVLGLGVLFLVFKQMFVGDGSVNGPEMARALEVLTGFSLGAESIALFARVGGGIYTKAADVGADLVGKVEAGIPEDDPRNPATIADNVGDNVGDVAGMGADLFGSFVATILATMVLGREILTPDDGMGGLSPILLPLVIAAIGIIGSLVGILMVRVKEGGDVQAALNRGNWVAVGFTAVGSFLAVTSMLPAGEIASSRAGIEPFTSMDVFWAILIGLVVGLLMSYITEHYTAMNRGPVNRIIQQAATGHATVVIGGLAVGMESTFLPILVLAGGIYGSYAVAGVYGVAIAAAGMMATTAMQLAIDAFGPIADNAGGIAEMSELPEEVRGRTDILDAVGNTTAATGKGFAIASAALTSLALFAAFMGVAGLTSIDISRANVLAGLFVGAMVPFLFSSLAIAAVGKAAKSMVEEVRRQFREIPGIMEGTATPQYERCVDISTNAAIREMMLPGLIALVTPVIFGFWFGPEVLGGLLAGVTVSGVMMAIFQSNAGGAWDNAKKSFEKGAVIDGETFYKKSEPHKASVTGDTVGDPLKDTSGPSMNILIKLMSITALVIAPFIKVDGAAGHGAAGHGAAPVAAMTAAPAVTGSNAFALNLAGTSVVLAGTVADEAAKTALVDQAKALFPDLTVVDSLTVGGDAAPAGWLDGLGRVMPLLGRVRMPGLAVQGEHITLRGTVPTDAAKAEIDSLGSAALQAPLMYMSEVTVQALSAEAAAATDAINKALAIGPVPFASGTSTLGDGASAILDTVAAVLVRYPGLKVRVEGHTDNTGDAAANQRLSQQRADAVKAYLVEKTVAADRMTAVGYGQARPMADNATETGRTANRRVAFTVE